MEPCGEIFVVHGDITQITADAIAYPVSITTGRDFPGQLTSAFDTHYPGLIQRWEALRAQKTAGKTHRQFDYGESFWIPLDETHAPYGVVVVATGGTHETTPKADAERRSVLGAIRESVQRLRERERRRGTPPARLLVALPAFRIGAGGSRKKDAAAVRAEVQAAREALDDAANTGVDVVFVTYTPRHAQLFLEARRALGLAPAVPAGLLPNDLLESLRSGQCVVFAGAGLSKAAGLMDFHALIERLAADLGLPAPLAADLDTYLDLAQWHREKFPEGDLGIPKIVRENLGEGAGWAKPTLDHYWLMSLPVRYVVTTNYDALLEKTLEAQRRFPTAAVTQEDIARTGEPGGVHVIKFHGDAAHSEDTLVLSRDDYDRFFTDRPVMAALLQGLLLNHTFFFVGYSLRDPNFRQIYSSISLMLKQSQRPAYATTFDAVGDYQKQQSARKQLYLLPLTGTLEEKVHAERCLLDQIAEQAAGQSLFLAGSREDPEAIGPAQTLGGLQRRLFEAGEEALRLSHGPLDWDEAQQLARTVTFLADAGWRPRGGSLTQLWLTLAERVAALETGEAQHRRFQRSLLRSALAHAESQEEADEARRRLEAFPQFIPGSG